MHRHAQMQHVFSFIMLILIAGVVLLLGYKFISSILGKTCDVEQLEFTNTLKKSLKSYAAYGSYHAVELPAACNARQVCFVDAGKYKTPDANGIYPGDSTFAYSNSANPSLAATIVNEVKSPSTPPRNIFLIDDKKVTTPIQLFGDKIALDSTANPSGVLCVDVKSGNFRVGFAGKGRTVLLTDES